MINKNYVTQVTTKAQLLLQPDEGFNLAVTGENMHYLRFNQSQIRQSTDVTQLYFQATLIKGAHACDWTWMSHLDLSLDLKSINQGFDYLRQLALSSDPIESLPQLSTAPSSEYYDLSQQPPNLTQVLNTIAQSQSDLVGLFMTGSQCRGSFNSLGQQHWYQRDIHILDYSVYTKGPDGKNKALKSTLAQKNWSDQKLSQELEQIKLQLNHFAKPSRALPPKNYRVFLAPAALAELLGLLGWGGLSYEAYRTGRCALRLLVDKQKELSPLVTLRQNFNLALDTPFNEQGEVGTPYLDLIRQGQLKNLLVSSTSASKYQVTSNFASASEWSKESPRCLEMLGGQLPNHQALSALDTGIYMSHLHYCNWSSLEQARITGMTRYGCFWVEQGQIQSPIQDLRFDVSLYDILGAQLEQLTQDNELIVSTDTYFELGLGGLSCPGALIKEFACVL